MHSPVGDALASLSKALRKARIRWYLFGAQAALLYGAARFTADVDVTVQIGAGESTALVGMLEKTGFRLRVRNVADFVARTRVLPFVHTASGMALDIVLAGPGLEEIFLKRVRRRTIQRVRVPVASPEDIIVMKMLAGRGKDEEDVLAMLTAQRKLKLAQLRDTLDALEHALDQRDLRPQFEKLLARVRRRAHPSARRGPRTST